MPRKLLGQHGYHRRVMERAEAVDLLRRLHQAQQAFYAGGDEAPVRALLTDDVHWHVPGRNAIAGDYQGSTRCWRTFVGAGTWWIAPSGCTLAICWLATVTALPRSPMGRPWSVASRAAGRPWTCTRSVTGGWRAAGCCPWTRRASTTSGRARTSEPADLTGTPSSITRAHRKKGARSGRSECPMSACGWQARARRRLSPLGDQQTTGRALSRGLPAAATARCWQPRGSRRIRSA